MYDDVLKCVYQDASPRTLLTAHKSKSYEERELEYNEARSRIFNTESVSHRLLFVRVNKSIFSERELTFAICYRPSICRLSVCLPSVTFVCPTQAVQIFGNISMALGTLAIH